MGSGLVSFLSIYLNRSNAHKKPIYMENSNPKFLNFLVHIGFGNRLYFVPYLRSDFGGVFFTCLSLAKLHYNNLGSSLFLGWFSMAFLEAIIPRVTDEQQMIDFLNKYKDSFPPESEVVRLSGSGLTIPHENDDRHCIRFYPIYVALGLNFPIPSFIRLFLWHYDLNLTHLSPSACIVLLGFLALRRVSGLNLGFKEFRELYIVKQRTNVDVYDIIPRDPDKVLITDIPDTITSGDQGWDCDVLEFKLKSEDLYWAVPEFQRAPSPYSVDNANAAPKARTFDRRVISKALELKREKLVSFIGCRKEFHYSS